MVADFGEIHEDLRIGAKEHYFSIEDLVGESKGRPFFERITLNAYLAPSDYHRVHMPINGRLTAATYIPGELFSVNPRTVAEIPGLYAKNERLVFDFKTDQGV